MRKIAAVSCAVSMCSASSVFATDITTTAPLQEQISRDSPSLQSFPGTGQQSFVFGDWGGLRSRLSNQGIDLDLSYLSEPAWNLAGGVAAGGTYAGQENLSLDLDWEKIAGINGFSTHIDFVSRLGTATLAVNM
jgi:porin